MYGGGDRTHGVIPVRRRAFRPIFPSLDKGRRKARRHGLARGYRRRRIFGDAAAVSGSVSRRELAGLHQTGNDPAPHRRGRHLQRYLVRNRTALDIAASLGLHSFVLENGYLRPFWVTLERDASMVFPAFREIPRSILIQAIRTERPSHNQFAARLRPHVINTCRHFAGAIAMWPILGFDPRYYGDRSFDRPSDTWAKPAGE